MAKTVFNKNLPSMAELKKKLKVKHVILVYDRKLKRHAYFQSWVNKFQAALPVTAGEELKSIQSFERHSKKVLDLFGTYSRSEVALVAVGGGSVGDFVGFMASVIKRGVVFANLPTTWLAAIDSAHGGKTALNLSDAKNQIGTFYEAKLVWMSQKILVDSGSANTQAAMGEVIKMLLLTPGASSVKMSKSVISGSFDLWKSLPFLVKSKMQVVKKDPFETKGHRQILNLGHTFGHIIESTHKLSHGVAVLIGLQFAIEWSRHRKLLKKSDLEKSQLLLETQAIPKLRLKKTEIAGLLLKDKKTQNKKVRFVFLKAFGKPFVEAVTAKQFTAECQRQGFIA